MRYRNTPTPVSRAQAGNSCAAPSQVLSRRLTGAGVFLRAYPGARRAGQNGYSIRKRSKFEFH